jgi:DNA-binding NtrC family response regulator
VVDDDEQVRALINSVLTGYGHDVSEASNGLIATRMYREQAFDVVITDLLMPDMEGIELIKELRSIDQNVKIIAMSGGLLGASATYLKTAQLMGAQQALPKPFNLDQLLTVVNTALTSA